jgi:type VI protein secretion system component VasK
MNTTVALAVVVLAIAAAGTAVFLVARRRRTAHLRGRFGTEYERALALDGGKAESLLAEREKRVDRLQLRPVPPELLESFALAWRADQARFVDEPEAAVAEADHLVQRVMSARGYPLGSAEQRGSDISVDHPAVMQNYRSAHELALKRSRGEASTEDLRQAFVHYRALFDHLLEVPRVAAAVAV